MSDRASLRQEQPISDEPIDATDFAEAVRSLRTLVLAGEHYRRVMATAVGLGTAETQALSYLAVQGETGQSSLARDLCLTSSASTALVDRLERHGVAERVRHPRDRRRSIVRLTRRGTVLMHESERRLAAALALVEPSQLGLVSTSMTTIARGVDAQLVGRPGRRHG